MPTLTPRAADRVRRTGSPISWPCPECGKQRFLTRRTAKRASQRAHPGKTLSIYRCGLFFHYGGLSPEMIAGRRTRDGRIHPDLELVPDPVAAAIMRAIWASTHPDPSQEAVRWPLTLPGTSSSQR